MRAFQLIFKVDHDGDFIVPCPGYVCERADDFNSKFSVQYGFSKSTIPKVQERIQKSIII